jgi:hypothetical protein
MAASACSFLRGLDLGQNETAEQGVVHRAHTRGSF